MPSPPTATPAPPKAARVLFDESHSEAWTIRREVAAEILRINDDVRPLALQIGLLVPVLAALLGFAQATRMTREPDPTPSEAAEGLLIG